MKFKRPGEVIPLFISIYKVASAALSGLRSVRCNYGNGRETSPGKYRVMQENL